MKSLESKVLQDALFRKRLLLISFALTAIIIGSIVPSNYNPAKWMTYRDFDVPAQKNFINYLSPGLKDVSTGTRYSFQIKHWGLLIGVLGGFFPVMLFLRVLGDPDLKICVYRYVTQWLTFVVARLGIFRVAGICPVKRSGLGVFPFMNCQSCELATGACPLGTFQMSLVNHEIPWTLIGQIIIAGIISGRWICGWLCPFGFLADIFDKLPGKRIKLPLQTLWLKYGVLALFLITSLSYLLRKNIEALFFCSFLCPVGFYFGVLEYALTTGLHAMIEQFPYFHFMFIYHCLIALAYIIGAVKLGGRFYCKYICPLGTIYGLFNKTALVRLIVTDRTCSGCGKCNQVCPMKIPVLNQKHLSKSSCILCGRCSKVCPTGKLAFSADILKAGLIPAPAAQAKMPKVMRAPVRAADRAAKRSTDKTPLLAQEQLPNKAKASAPLKQRRQS